MNEPTEEWRTISEFPSYSVSSQGRIRRDIGGRGLCLAGRIIATHVRPDGYIRVRISENNKPFSRYVHRLMAIAFLGPPPTISHEAAHKDGVKANIYLSNIKWATPEENAADKLIHGTRPMGTDYPQSKLDDQAIVNIRGYVAKGFSRRMVGAMFGVSHATINSIISCRKWKHVA